MADGAVQLDQMQHRYVLRRLEDRNQRLAVDLVGVIGAFDTSRREAAGRRVRSVEVIGLEYCRLTPVLEAHVELPVIGRQLEDRTAEVRGDISLRIVRFSERNVRDIGLCRPAR